MKMNVSKASLRYSIRMNQNLYNDADVTDSGSTPGSSALTLATHFYMPPLNPSELQKDLKIEVNKIEDSNTLRFIFKAANNAFDLNRISTILVTGKVDGGEPTSVSYSDFTGQTPDNQKYVGYDLSLLKGVEAGKTATFTVSVRYDSGYGGQKYLKTVIPSGDGNTGNVIAEAFGNDDQNQYMRWIYTVNANGNSILQNPSIENSAGRAVYKVQDITGDKNLWPAEAKAEEGDLFVRFKNTKNYFPSEYTAEQKEAAESKQVLQLRLGTSGYKGVEVSAQPLLKVEKEANYTKDEGGRDMSVTIGNLKPTISNVVTRSALTTASISFRTNSRELLEPQEIVVEVWDGDDMKKLKTVTVPVENSELATLKAEFDELEQGKSYRIHVKGIEKGTTKLADLIDNDRGSAAVYSITMMDGMEVVPDAKEPEIVYKSYKEKWVDIGYSLTLTEGFNITYELMKMENGSPVPTGVTHEQIMAAMGYHQDNGQWINEKGAAWSYMSEMSETINLSTNSLMQPGNTYRLYIHAKDSKGNSVTKNEAYVTIVWNKLFDAGFYVETRPGDDGKSLAIDVTPQDPNRVIADGTYVIALYDQSNTCVYKVAKNVEEGIVRVTADNLKSNGSYKLRIYAYRDLDNIGNVSGIQLSDVDNKTFEELENNKAYSSDEKMADTWGGRFDKIQLSRDAAKRIQVVVFNGYNLDKIKTIQMTVNWVDSDNVAHSENKTISAGSAESLFTLRNASSSTYIATMPIEIEDDDAQYAVTLLFMDESGKQIYRDSVPYLPI